MSGNLEQLPDAEALLLQATELSPDEPLLHYELALTRVQLGDWSGARDALQRAEILTGEIPEIERDLARVLERTGQRREAALARARYLRLLDDLLQRW